MKYVTYYDSLLGGIQDVVFHDDKKSAVNYYRKYARCYFDGLTLPKKTTVPTACGFVHRMFVVMSSRSFKRNNPEYFKESVEKTKQGECHESQS